MGFSFSDVKLFLQLRDSTIDLVPHYADDATFDSIGFRFRGRDDLRMVELRRTVEATVDSILAEVSELRGRSA
jgi:hypothetical protein